MFDNHLRILLTRKNNFIQILKVCLLLFLFLLPLQLLAQGQWTEITTTPNPGPRFGHTIVSLNDTLYLFGGLTETAIGLMNHAHSKTSALMPMNDTWEGYLTAKHAMDWVKVATDSSPNPRYGHASWADKNNDDIYVFGGYVKTGETIAPDNDLWEYSAGANTWSQVFAEGSNNPPPTADATVTVTDDNKVVISGGTDIHGIPSDEIWIFDPVANSYTQGTSFPGTMNINYESTRYAYNGKVVLAGSGDEIYVYDPATDSWHTETTSGNPPPNRVMAGHAQIGNTGYIFGGEDVNTAAPMQDAWQFDFTTNTWSQLPDMPLAVNKPGAVSFKSSGGLAKNTNTGNDAILIYGGLLEDGTSSDRMFVCIPEITSVETETEMPDNVHLCQNYPNPFNPTTRISYSVPSSNFVTLRIYDSLGRKIQTLVNQNQKANTYTISFDANEFSSGRYFYRLNVGNDIVETRKMLLMQ